MERARRQLGQPEPIFELVDQIPVVEGLPGGGKDLEQGENAQKLFVACEVARHDVEAGGAERPGDP
jgi:hypothetical protein